MENLSDTSIILVTANGQTVYPHDTNLQSNATKMNYRLDSWEPPHSVYGETDCLVYVYEWPGPGRRLARRASEFGLTVQKRAGGAK